MGVIELPKRCAGCGERIRPGQPPRVVIEVDVDGGEPVERTWHEECLPAE